MAKRDLYIEGYRMGLLKGRNEAMIEFQKQNNHHDLPSNKALDRVFELLQEYERTNRFEVHFNEMERRKNYITTHWNG